MTATYVTNDLNFGLRYLELPGFLVAGLLKPRGTGTTMIITDNKASNLKSRMVNECQRSF